MFVSNLGQVSVTLVRQDLNSILLRENVKLQVLFQLILTLLGLVRVRQEAQQILERVLLMSRTERIVLIQPLLLKENLQLMFPSCLEKSLE